MTTTLPSTDQAAWYALVADDDDDSRALVAAILRGAQFSVCEASNGEELLERYHALNLLTDQRVLVVSDIEMPGMDGLAAAKELRTLSAHIPIVIVSGFTDEDTACAARIAGVNEVMPKPVSKA